jgi:hypothetical protein
MSGTTSRKRGKVGGKVQFLRPSESKRKAEFDAREYDEALVESESGIELARWDCYGKRVYGDI